jgi:uncharacterized protein YggE
MDTYIEVVGSASLLERTSEYRADVTLVVRAAQIEMALREVVDLRSQCIRKLKEAGLAGDELREGGTEVWRPWFWKKKPGQEAAQKILVSCDDAQRLYYALSALEPIFENQRYSLSVSMRRPRFVATDEARRKAQSAAIADAKLKAQIIASEAGVQLVTVAQVEELDEKSARSGMYGDEEWSGYAIAVAGSAASEGTPETLESAERITTVRYRVRFTIESAQPSVPAVGPGFS